MTYRNTGDVIAKLQTATVADNPYALVTHYDELAALSQEQRDELGAAYVALCQAVIALSAVSDPLFGPADTGAALESLSDAFYEAADSH